MKILLIINHIMVWKRELDLNLDVHQVTHRTTIILEGLDLDEGRREDI